MRSVGTILALALVTTRSILVTQVIKMMLKNSAARTSAVLRAHRGCGASVIPLVSDSNCLRRPRGPLLVDTLWHSQRNLVLLTWQGCHVIVLLTPKIAVDIATRQQLFMQPDVFDTALFKNEYGVRRHQ